MNTAGNASTDSTSFTLDPDFLNRQLAATMANNNQNYALQSAQNKAQAAYQSKLVELQKQGLGLQAQQIAQSYAMEQAKLEFEKQSFAQTYGLQSQQQGWQQQFDEKQSALDNAYKTAEQTGFRDGVPTLANLQMQQQNTQFNAQLGFNQQQLAEQQRVADQGNALDLQKLQESQREFNQQQADAGSQWNRTFDAQNNQFQQTFGEGARQFDVSTANQVDQFGRTLANQQQEFGQTLGENQRQFNTSSVLNAPRGPADWAAYANRMRGLQASGALPGGSPGASGQNDIQGFGSVGPMASYSNQGQFNGNVLSNTDLALAATGQGDPAKLQGTAWQGMYGSQAAPAQSNGGAQQGQGASQSSGGASAYGGDQSAYGGPAGGNTAQGQGNGGADISLPSLQKYRRYAPTEQAMGLGYIAENGGPTAEDAQYQMQRSAPNYQQSRSARYAGM